MQGQHNLEAPAPHAERGPLQKQTYAVENPVLEINLYASGNILDPLPMIDLREVDANL